MDLDPGIEKKITGNRKVHMCQEHPDEFPGFNLAKPSNEPVPKFDRHYVPKHKHYRISSPGCKTMEDALKGFWIDYNKQGPYSDGDIYWRLRPTIHSEQSFRTYYTSYLIEARFSIKEKAND